MEKHLILQTNRLILRLFTLEDAPAVQRLAGEKDIAATTLHIPHPYEDGMAEEWIGKHQEEYEKGEQVTFAIVHREEKYLVGAIGLSGIREEHERAEIGYWIGKPYWNQDYCTEAVKAVLQYSFDVLKLNRVYARHFKRNPASGRVMQKVGMKYEGCLRQHFKKWGNFEDSEMYGILREEFCGSEQLSVNSCS
ncbi:MAG: GNAT family N-acetyltransferase [bacterium]|nr:MAG: GNAT family N-acetyltransferase [bacterium]